MNVALIHHQFIRGGGTERYLADLVRGFADAGDDVTVIASKIGDDVPEPASALLGLSGIVLMITFVRRRPRR